MFNNRSFQIFSIIALVAVLISACGRQADISTVEPSVPQSFNVPSYATIDSALGEASYYIEDSQEFFYDESTGGQIVSPGFLGVLVDDAMVYRLLDDWDSASNYGQSCMFEFSSEDTIDYSVKEKTLTYHVRATTLNQQFLQWCRTQMPSKADVYIITATESSGGYTIYTSQESWDILPIFRIDD